MKTPVEKAIARAVSPRSVRLSGNLTVPRTYGVYRLPHGSGDTRCYRYGNHPIRMKELEREFGSCKLEHLFLARSDASLVAGAFNRYVA